jgi:hypothetical protein
MLIICIERIEYALFLMRKFKFFKALKNLNFLLWYAENAMFGLTAEETKTHVNWPVMEYIGGF